MGADLKQIKEEAPICRAHLTNNIGVIVDGLLGQNAFNSDIMAIMQDFIGVCRRQIRNWVKSIYSLFILTIHLGAVPWSTIAQENQIHNEHSYDWPLDTRRVPTTGRHGHRVPRE